MPDLSAPQKRTLAAATEPLVRLIQRVHRAARRGGPPPDLTDPAAAHRVRKVLVVRLDAIGDVLLSEPALRMLRTRFPNATVHLVANPASAMVLEGSPSVDRVIPYRAPWHALWRGGSVHWRAETAELWRLSAQLRAERYDVAFELRGDYRDIVFAATAAPKLLVGSGIRGGGRLLDGDAVLPENGHQVELAAAIASYGANVPTVDAPRVHPTERHYAKAREHLGNGGATIALHLGAGFPSKSLPLDKFHAIVRSLIQTDRNRRFVILGGQEERELVDKFLLGLPAETATIDLCAALSLLESAAVLAHCKLFIGNDSAPMHLAAAMGTPVVTFFGPSEPWKFHPYGCDYRLVEVDLACRPCDYVHCLWPAPLLYQCMTRQSVTAITQAAEALLRKEHPSL